MKKQIIFIEGIDLSGKDTFLKTLTDIFGKIYYPSSKNFIDYDENVIKNLSWELTFNTIFDSIRKSNDSLFIVYRSPYSNYLYNDGKKELEYMEEIKKEFSCYFLVGNPSLNILKERYNKRSDEKYNFNEIEKIYYKYIDFFGNFNVNENIIMIDDFFKIMDIEFLKENKTLPILFAKGLYFYKILKEKKERKEIIIRENNKDFLPILFNIIIKEKIKDLLMDTFVDENGELYFIIRFLKIKTEVVK